MKKILLLILALAMTLPGSYAAFADTFSAYWGQDFPDEETWWQNGEAVFWHEPEFYNYEFNLMKDGVSVYDVRIGEGYIDEASWGSECIFMPHFAENGSGRYTFSVSALTDSGKDIEEETVVKTAHSGGFTYTKPSASLSAPRVVSNENGKLDWTYSDPNTDAYLYQVKVNYDGIKYDLYFSDVYETEEYSEISYEGLRSTLEFWQSSNPEKYPADKAKLEIRFLALPLDINEYNPSPYTPWYTVEGSLSAEGNAPEAVDRSSIPETSAYFKSAKLTYDLGIMPDIYKNHEKTVTRGDLAIVLTQLLGYSSMAESNQTCQFTDVEQNTYLAGCINAIVRSGLLNGTSNTEFSPDEPALCKHIMNTLVAAVGYEPIAIQMGGFPYGYMNAASSCGILDGISASMDSEITMGQLSQAVANSLNVGLLKQTGFGSTAKYEETDDTLLYSTLGISKASGNVEFTGKSSLKISGILKNSANPLGISVENKNYSVKDADAEKYGISNLTLYVKNGTVLSAFPYWDAIITVCGGESTTTSQVVPITVKAYGYTKFKFSDQDSYVPITEETYYHFIDSTLHKKYTYTLNFANDDESVTTTKSASVTYSNLHKVYLMVNGELFQTLEKGYGAKLTGLTTPQVNGYIFKGWENHPETMPDWDITIHADMAPSVVINGTITYNGSPVTNCRVSSANAFKYVDYSGSFTITAGRDEKYLTIDNYSSGKTETIEINPTGETLDLGTIELGDISICIEGEKDLLSVSGLDNLITDGDKEFVLTEGNEIDINMSVEPITQNPHIAEKLASEYKGYGIAAMYDINIAKTPSTSQGNLETEKITETDSLIAIQLKIPKSQQGKSEYVVIREHAGAIDVLKTTKNAYGEYIEIQGETVIIYCKRFSAYALISQNENSKFVVTLERTSINSAELLISIPENAKDAKLYIAKYNHKGALISCEIKETIENSYNILADEQTAKIKAFIWNSNMMPL